MEWIVEAESKGDLVDGYGLIGEELVRCEHCKHNSLNLVSGNTFCDLGIGLYQLYDFCSMGEKKDDE